MKKILVLENVSNIDPDLKQYLVSMSTDDNEFDIFTNLLQSNPKEIKKRVFEADEIVLKSLFFDREQMGNMIDLIVECAKIKKTTYKVSVMFLHNNKFLDFLNKDLTDVDLKLKIISSLTRIELHEILCREVDSGGNKAYFTTNLYEFECQPVLFYHPFTQFIHDWNLKQRSQYVIEHGQVDFKPNNWLEDLSEDDMNTLIIILNEHKAKLAYDLEDKDAIRAMFDKEEAEDLIQEKEKCIDLLNKIS